MNILWTLTYIKTFVIILGDFNKNELDVDCQVL